MNLARTVNYPPTGEGRDTYIKKDNGGFFKRERPGSAMSVGTFNSHRQKPEHLAHIGAKAINYGSNGTGRDSYIK